MSILRKLGLGFAGLMLSLSVGLFLTALTITPTLLNKDEVKTWLNDSGLYESLRKQAVDSTANSLNNEGPLLNSDTVRPALSAAVDTNFVRQQSETALDTTYAWLEGEEVAPQLVIDLSDQKDAFYTTLIKTIEPKIKSLPTCSAFADQTTESVLQLRCLPVGLTAAEAAAEISRQVTDDAGFERITSEPINNTSQSTKTATTTTINVLRTSLWLAPVVAVIAGASMVLIAQPRAKGLRSAGVHLTASGGVALVAAVTGLVVAPNITFAGLIDAGSGAQSGVVASFDEIIRSAVFDMSTWLAIGAGVITVIGITIVVIAFNLNKPKLELPQASLGDSGDIPPAAI